MQESCRPWPGLKASSLRRTSRFAAGGSLTSKAAARATTARQGRIETAAGACRGSACFDCCWSRHRLAWELRLKLEVGRALASSGVRDWAGARAACGQLVVGSSAARQRLVGSSACRRPRLVVGSSVCHGRVVGSSSARRSLVGLSSCRRLAVGLPSARRRVGGSSRVARRLVNGLSVCRRLLGGSSSASARRPFIGGSLCASSSRHRLDISESGCLLQNFAPNPPTVFHETPRSSKSTRPPPFHFGPDVFPQTVVAKYPAGRLKSL